MTVLKPGSQPYLRWCLLARDSLSNTFRPILPWEHRRVVALLGGFKFLFLCLLGTSTAHSQGEKRDSADKTESGEYMFHVFSMFLVSDAGNLVSLARF